MSCSATIVYSDNDGYDQINAAAVVLEIWYITQIRTQHEQIPRLNGH